MVMTRQREFLEKLRALAHKTLKTVLKASTVWYGWSEAVSLALSSSVCRDYVAGSFD